MFGIWKKSVASFLATMLFLGSFGVGSVFAQSKSLTCESFGGEYNYCKANTDNKVKLDKRLSLSSCTYGRDWGYDRRGIWVDHGCRAEFNYGDGKGAAIAGGAILGGLILAGVLASKNRRSEENSEGWKDSSSHVESFFIGTFRGWNPDRDETVDVTIKPDGSVSLWNEESRTSQYGEFRDRLISLPWGDYHVEKDGSGILATADDGRTFTYVRVR
jgi:hypothetical protein